LAVLVIGLIFGGLVGYVATPKGVPQDQFNTLQAQNTALESQVTQLQIQVDQLEGKANKTETINLAHSPSIGQYFTDIDGFALYYFAKDTPGTGISTANSQTLTKWAPFYVSPIVAAMGINMIDFSIITGPTGSPQLAYKGWPLYKFLNDKNPGETNGEGFADLWWVMKPNYTLMLSYTNALGLHFSTINDEGIYYFAGDIPSSNSSNIAGNLAYPFKPFFEASINVPSTVDTLLFSTITGQNGTRQVAYRGWPLYSCIQDVNPGDVFGDSYNIYNETTVLPLWFLMKYNYNLMIAFNDFQGVYLTDGMGRTLYYNVNDQESMPIYMNTQFWTPYNSTPTVAPNALPLDSTKLFTRSDGLSQVEYLTYPLYYYVGDAKPGDMKGNSLMGEWFIINPFSYLYG